MTHDIKERVKSAFNRSWKTYDLNCYVQNLVSKQSIELLLNYFTKFKFIGDFACGTGNNTNTLIRNVFFKKCYAIDFSEKLLLLAKQRIVNNNVEFILSDIDKPLFKKSYLDLISCNMGLQWVPNIQHTLALFRYYLKKNGVLVFSIPLVDNFPELKSQYKNPMLEYSNIISTLKINNLILLEFKSISSVQTFSSVYKAIKSIKSTGANCCINRNLKKNISKIDINSLFYNPSQPTLTYNLGVFLCMKK